MESFEKDYALLLLHWVTGKGKELVNSLFCSSMQKYYSEFMLRETGDERYGYLRAMAEYEYFKLYGNKDNKHGE